MFFSRRRLPIESDRNASRRLRREKSHLRRAAFSLEPLESRRLLTTYVVNSTADDLVAPPADPTEMTLRMAITNPNLAGGSNRIEFAIPAETYPDSGTPVAGFDPSTQEWTITLTNGPLPTITTPVAIDGFSQAHFEIPFRYPDQFTSEVQSLAVDPTTTSGAFQLTVPSYVDHDGITRGGQTATYPL